MYQQLNSISKIMSKAVDEDIVIYDDQEKEYPQPESPLKNAEEAQIFVFDDEEEEEVDNGIKEIVSKQVFSEEHLAHVEELTENPFEEPQVKSHKETPSMSHKEFKERCSKLEDRIIFSNLKNFKEDVMKPQKTFFQQAKMKRRESEKRRKSKLPDIQRLSLYAEITKDVKVDFLVNNTSIAKKSKPIPKQSLFRPEADMESTLNDEISSSQFNSFNKSNDNSYIQGACIGSSKKELKIEEIKGKNILKVSNFREFLYTQLKPNYQIFLLIKRTENGLINSTYKFYFQQNKKFIMSCEKQGFCSYVFSSSEVHISEEHISYLGKMECNFMGSQFVFYDSGEDCSKTKMMENYKKQLGYISYKKESDQPRKFETVITTCDNKLTDFTIIDKNSDNIIMDKWGKQNRDHLAYLETKEPNYDPEDCNFKLDFRGLAGVPSIKNFIVENAEHPDALIFGRQDKETYLMRIKAPFSLLQAVAVCMSSIHYKFI